MQRSPHDCRLKQKTLYKKPYKTWNPWIESTKPNLTIFPSEIADSNPKDLCIMAVLSSILAYSKFAPVVKWATFHSNINK